MSIVSALAVAILGVIVLVIVLGLVVGAGICAGVSVCPGVLGIGAVIVTDTGVDVIVIATATGTASTDTATDAASCYVGDTATAARGVTTKYESNECICSKVLCGVSKAIVTYGSA
jgi:hypothetical protein